MPKLGFVGLGTMGGQMVNRLLAKGHSVTGYNRTRSKAEWLVAKGMMWADSPRAVAASSDSHSQWSPTPRPSMPSPKVPMGCWPDWAPARFSST